MSINAEDFVKTLLNNNDDKVLNAVEKIVEKQNVYEASTDPNETYIVLHADEIDPDRLSNALDAYHQHKKK